MKIMYYYFWGIIVGLLVYGCNSGSSSVQQISLPAGSYNSALTNITPSVCSQNMDESEIFTSNGNGQLCNDSLCLTLNLAVNPCLAINNKNGVKRMLWSNCAFESTTGVMVAVANANVPPIQCTANLTLTLQK